VRILIYGINFSPELVGIGKYSGELASWLAEQGDEVRVITAPPYYPAWRVQAPYAGWRYRHEAGRVSVLRCPLWVPAKPSGLTRILHLFSFALSSFFPALWQAAWRPDIVLVIEPPLFCAPAAWLTARLGGAKACLHVQDFEVDAAFDLGVLKSKGLRKLALAVESWLMRRFDKVFTISPRMLDKLQQKNVPVGRCALFPNWVDTTRIYPLERPSQFRARWNIPEDRIVYLYSGNIGAKQGLENLIEAARSLQNDTRLIFVICGHGAFYAQLRALAHDVKNIQWHELQPAEELNELLNLADIHLLPQRANAADLVMPSKLTGMLASGKPIITTALPGTQVAEVVAHAGLVVPPDHVKDLIAAMRQLAHDRDFRRRLGQEARQYALRYLDQEKILREFRRHIAGIGR
jgi:colanic acid biosynthesis glycosyl transferase WcaI